MAMKLVYFSVTSNEIPNLSEATGLFGDTIAPLEIYARTRTQLEDNLRNQQAFIAHALEADAVVVTLMSGSQSCPAWDGLLKALQNQRAQGFQKPYFHIQPTGSNPVSMKLVEQHSDGLDTQDWKTLSRYYRYAGVDNLKNMLVFFYNLTCNGKQEIQPPIAQPYHGIYHPDHGFIADKEDFLHCLNPDKATVGIWFYQNFWTSNNKSHIDAMIREVEKQGANVICVFHLRFKDSLLGNQGADHVLRTFFMDSRGRPLIDVLINPVMFSLQTASPDYRGLLECLGVPVIQAISTSRSIADWQTSEQGLNNVDITISVAQPELDGVLITVPVASKQCVGTDLITGAAINKYVPIHERIEKMVRLALNWAMLRKKDNAQKKVAIIFHHYPPRNDRIGCASGLDSFASITSLVKALDKNGYCVDHIYSDGDELAQALLGCITIDRRWLLPEQMANRAQAWAGPERYCDWHESLPRGIRQRMQADWGPLPGDLFVHNHQLLFPGLINGNLFITIQPPRGYFEQIDKLYHDQHMSPPHHYLAHYRWIRDVFGADAVIHVGKHGSLEWLPGKAVGLGPECYPDLVLDDLPNVYPYIINDPGEGSQAKRRSSACIIDQKSISPGFEPNVSDSQE
jgi:cobaltochelatase CobN